MKYLSSILLGCLVKSTICLEWTYEERGHIVSTIKVVVSRCPVRISPGFPTYFWLTDEAVHKVDLAISLSNELWRWERSFVAV